MLECCNQRKRYKIDTDIKSNNILTFTAVECTSVIDGVCSVPETLKNWIPQWTLSLFEEDCID